MMTAVGVGVLFLAAIAWSWGQLVRFPIPTPRWTFSLAQVEGTLTPGQTVALTKAGSTGETIAAGTVESYTPSIRTARVILDKINIEPLHTLRDTKQAVVAAPDGSRAFFANVTVAEGIPIFRLLYLQSAVAALIAVAGIFTIYTFIGRKPGPVEFLIATDSEMKKVNWGTRRVIIDSTYVVIGATFLIAGIIFAADSIFAIVFQRMGILGSGSSPTGGG